MFHKEKMSVFKSMISTTYHEFYTERRICLLLLSGMALMFHKEKMSVFKNMISTIYCIMSFTLKGEFAFCYCHGLPVQECVTVCCTLHDTSMTQHSLPLTMLKRY